MGYGRHRGRDKCVSTTFLPLGIFPGRRESHTKADLLHTHGCRDMHIHNFSSSCFLFVDLAGGCIYNLWTHSSIVSIIDCSCLMVFMSVLSDCNLFDLGFHGVPWTYNNKQEGYKNVKVRPDLAVACPQWSSLFPDCKISHVISSRSDHCPLLIQLLRIPRVGKIVKQLKYEAYWEREGVVLEDQIKVSWNEGRYVEDLKDVGNNLNSVMKNLHV